MTWVKLPNGENESTGWGGGGGSEDRVRKRRMERERGDRQTSGVMLVGFVRQQKGIVGAPGGPRGTAEKGRVSRAEMLKMRE